MNDLILENINEEYGSGKYGNFNIIIMKKNGYVNVTKLCKDGGKEFKDWLETQQSQELFKELKTELGIEQPLITIRRSVIGNPLVSGTYAHPYLIPIIASWVSIKFANMLSLIVNEQLAIERLKNENVNLMAKIKEMEKKADERYVNLCKLQN